MLHWMVVHHTIMILHCSGQSHLEQSYHFFSLLFLSGQARKCVWASYLIWSWVPPDVAFEIAHAASFLISNSAFWSEWTRGAIRLASITVYRITKKVRNTKMKYDVYSPSKPRIYPKLCQTKKRLRVSACTWIWSLLPAVMFDIVQQASFLMLFLWLLVKRLKRQGNAWWLMINWK